MRTLAGFERIDVARHFGLCDSEKFPRLRARNCSARTCDNRNNFGDARCAVSARHARISELLSASYFIQAQIFPYNYQDVIVRGNATRINALFLREYFRQRHSIPGIANGARV